MNKNYTILSITPKTSTTGKPYAVLQLADETGAEYKASMWDNFSDLVLNGTVEGSLETKGNFTNFRRYSALPKPNFVRGAQAGVAKAMETKAANIAVAQDRKHDAIAKAGAFRDATLVSLAELRDQPFPTEGEYKARWEYWVKYFLGKHEEPFV